MTNTGTRTGIFTIRCFLRFDFFHCFGFFSCYIQLMTTAKRKTTLKPTESTPTVKQLTQSDLTPADIAMFAEQEDDRKPAETHISAIRVLRDRKNFSFREIAEWLHDFGVKVDSNAVYRAYMNDALQYCSSQEEVDQIAREANAEMESEKTK